MPAFAQGPALASKPVWERELFAADRTLCPLIHTPRRLALHSANETRAKLTFISVGGCSRIFENGR